MSPRRAVRAALLVLALSAPAAPAARAADAPDAYRVPKPTERGLKNQMKVYIFEDHRLPMVSYRFVLRAGSAHEPAEKAGLANLMLHVLRQGSETMDADSLARRLDAMGGSIDGVTGRDYMALTGRFLSRDWRAGLDVLSDLVQHPAFRQDDFERQREQVLAGIRAALEQDATTASRHVEALVYGAHPYAHAVTGDASSVSSLTRDDLVAFHGTYVHSNLALLEIVGDVDPQQVMFEIEGQFRDWERGEPPSRPGPALPEFENNRVRLLDHPGAEQAELRIGFDGPPPPRM